MNRLVNALTIVAISLVAGSTSAQTTILNKPFCAVNPTASAINDYQPQCPQLGTAGEWHEFDITVSGYGNYPAVTLEVGPSVPVGPTWVSVSGQPDSRLQEIKFADSFLITFGDLTFLHNICTGLSSVTPAAGCISLGQLRRTLNILFPTQFAPRPFYSFGRHSLDWRQVMLRQATITSGTTTDQQVVDANKELLHGLLESEVRYDAVNDCKYVPLCEQ